MRMLEELITEEQKDALLSRILASPLFAKSPRLSAFLSFVCEQARLGLAEQINEQRIGVMVFGRSAGYHVGEDSIVRSQARFLRKRLEEYFSATGADEDLILSIPKGSYLPVFELRNQHSEAPVEIYPSADEPAPTQEHRLPPSRLPLSWVLLTVLAVVLAAMSGVWFERHHAEMNATAGSDTPEGRFWRTFLDPRRTLLVVPSDSSLVLLQQMSGHEVNLTDYMNRTYLGDPGTVNPRGLWQSVTVSQYTSLADMNLLWHLQSRPELLRTNTQIRFARDLNLNELKTGNPLLIGGRRSNPWVELWANRMHYSVDYDPLEKRNFVWNLQRQAGEPDRYYELADAHQHEAFGIIALLPSLDGQGYALLVGGTSKAGTEAAAEFLFNRKFGDFLGKLAGNKAIPHFELLIATQNINGESQDGKIISYHKLD